MRRVSNSPRKYDVWLRTAWALRSGDPAVRDIAGREGYLLVLEGSNADDLKDFRPGRRACQELGVRSPLLEAGLTKEEIRTLSRELGLKTFDKPAQACLSSRIPTGRP